MAIFDPSDDDTVNLAVTGTAQAFTLPSGGGSETILLTVLGTEDVFWKRAGTATVNNGVPLPKNTAQVFKRRNMGSISVIAAAAGSKIYATVGVGE